MVFIVTSFFTNVCYDWNDVYYVKLNKRQLKMISGLKHEAADRLVKARAQRMFTSTQDLARRAHLAGAPGDEHLPRIFEQVRVRRAVGTRVVEQYEWSARGHPPCLSVFAFPVEAA